MENLEMSPKMLSPFGDRAQLTRSEAVKTVQSVQKLFLGFGKIVQRYKKQI